MPTIPFPNIPAFPGVPPLVRQAATSLPANIIIGLGNTFLSNLNPPGAAWGIYLTGTKTQLGATGTFVSPLTALKETILGVASGLSTYSFDYRKEMRVSDYPVEGGSFVTYNKVELPASPVVTMAFSGSSSDRHTFLGQIDAATKSVNGYDITTPEVTYVNYTIELYSYERRAYRGATLLMVELTLKEIRTAAAAYTTAPLIVAPQNSSDSDQQNGGIVQSVVPTSTLNNAFTSLFGGK